MDQKKNKRHCFTPMEDARLIELVNTLGTSNWQLISQEFINRTARQCRDRFTNYLAPNSFNGPWTREENLLLIYKYKEIGPKWVQMSKYFHCRTPNSIKNRWNFFFGNKKKHKADQIAVMKALGQLEENQHSDKQIREELNDETSLDSITDTPDDNLTDMQFEETPLYFMGHTEKLGLNYFDLNAFC